ncbi:MAG TPA: hypothetical protein P5186_17425 [Candidatus Paceibacterota bacterium]|nr:hypothetical protein [Verrucomicrobiota bacterium]HRY49832.1 hypothetical protein [Candidatus Paceibacterota bacterium]
MVSIDPNQERHCPRLGHSVTLAYCVREGLDLPCRLIDSCWQDRIPVREYLLTLYSESQLEKLHGPTSKLASIVDLIHQARTSQ